MSETDPRIIVALDYLDAAPALDLSQRLDPARCRLKIGKQLFTRAGPDVVERLHARGFTIFLDLKFHDIPNTVAGACRAAAELGVWMLSGSIMVRVADGKVNNRSYLLDAQGAVVAIYNKVHLFDVDLPDSEESYRESHSMYAGDDPTTVDTPAGRVGLTICYDVRFPELFRVLVDAGATVFTVPAAFTAVTGAAHWATLLRARAIENLAYVIAPGQFGTHPDNRETYGHSMIVDPWGRVLAEQASGNAAVVADIDPDAPAQLRTRFPALANRRL